MTIGALAEPEAYAFDLFVIHADADADFVRGYLLPALDLAPARVLRIDKLPLGGIVVSEIARAVARSRFTIAVLSPAYLVDRWTVYGEQLASHVSAQHPRVIPLRLVDCELPLNLDALVSLDFRDSGSWGSEVARLRTLLGTAPPAPVQIACPYPGMRPFAEKDAEQFFGRDQEVAELIARIDHGERELYVIGPSGSGKSSLVRAGLLHTLDAGTSLLGRSFAARTMRPGEQPAERLAQLLEGDLATPVATVEAFVARHAGAERALVFVDQLEELFTLASAAERQRFIAALRALRAVSQCWLLLALRADFLGALLDSELGPDLAGRMRPFMVAPLRGAALAEAIRHPAARVGVYLDMRLCDRLVADADDEPGALPLVQETLRLLWDSRRHRYLGLAAYEALGRGGSGLDVAITRRANTAMSALSESQQTVARRVLLRLVSFGEGRADTRRQRHVSRLRSAADADAELSQVLQHLVDHRLVTLDAGEAAHDPLAELAHEALIRAWPALRAWIDGRRADEQRRQRLDAKVSEWIERGRGTASLLDPVELAEAMTWSQSDGARELGYRTELPCLVEASRSAIEDAARRRRRRAARVITGLAAFSVIASALGLVAWHQRQAAERQTRETHRLLGMSYLEQGRALLWDGHPLQALPYLVDARTEGISGDALHKLFAQARSSLPLVTLTGHTSSVIIAAFSPDGTRVLTASRDKTARIWDVTTGTLLTPPLAHQADIAAAMFGPDGREVVTASTDGTLHIWDATTGNSQVTALIEHGHTVDAMALSLDAARAVTVSDGRTVRVWDVRTGTPVTAPFDHKGATVVGFSSDGRRVSTVNTSLGVVWVWNAKTGKAVSVHLNREHMIDLDDPRGGYYQTIAEPVTGPLDHKGAITAISLSRDGTLVGMAGGYSSAQIWDVSTGLSASAPLQHDGTVTAMSFSVNNRFVATASTDGTARIWDARSGRPDSAPLEHHAIVSAVTFSPSGEQLSTVSTDHTARIWDANGKLLTLAPLEHDGSINAVSFSPDGKRVVTASADRTARVWNTASTSETNDTGSLEDWRRIAAPYGRPTTLP